MDRRSPPPDSCRTRSDGGSPDFPSRACSVPAESEHALDSHAIGGQLGRARRAAHLQQTAAAVRVSPDGERRGLLCCWRCAPGVRNGARRLTKVSPSATPTGHAASRRGSVLFARPAASRCAARALYLVQPPLTGRPAREPGPTRPTHKFRRDPIPRPATRWPRHFRTACRVPLMSA